MDLIEKYFNNRPPDTIVNRTKTITRTSRGKSYDQIIVCANIPTQQTIRTKTLRTILQMKQVIASIEVEEKQEVLARKGVQVHSRLKKYINK
jgi:hypothetical protein